MLIVPEEHPLAEADHTLSIAELSEHPLLLASPGTTFRQAIDEAFRAEGVAPKIKAEVDGLRLLASFAFGGFGVAIVPATAAPEWVGGQWRKRTVAGLGRRTVGLATRRRGMLSLAAHSAANVIQELIATQAQSMSGLELPAET